MTQIEILPALNFTPPVITLNFEDLEARIDGITEQYKGLVVKEEDVPAIKSEMAGLNHLAGGLAAARKDAAAKISVPIKEFENRVKKLETKVVDTRSFLDEQVKDHIRRERDSKRAHVQVMIDAQKDDHGCPGLEIPIQESWLNKTAKDKTTTAEILAIILAHKKAQEEAAALEQAKKDRVVMIERHNRDMAKNRDYELPFSAFIRLQSLDLPLSDVLGAIEEAYAREDAKRQAKPESVEQPAPHWVDPPAQTERSVSCTKAMTITAIYDSENGPKIGELYKQLKALCRTCTAEVKELQ